MLGEDQPKTCREEKRTRIQRIEKEFKKVNKELDTYPLVDCERGGETENCRLPPAPGSGQV